MTLDLRTRTPQHPIEGRALRRLEGQEGLQADGHGLLLHFLQARAGLAQGHHLGRQPHATEGPVDDAVEHDVQRKRGASAGDLHSRGVLGRHHAVRASDAVQQGLGIFRVGAAPVGPELLLPREDVEVRLRRARLRRWDHVVHLHLIRLADLRQVAEAEHGERAGEALLLFLDAPIDVRREHADEQLRREAQVLESPESHDLFQLRALGEVVLPSEHLRLREQTDLAGGDEGNRDVVLRDGQGAAKLDLGLQVVVDDGGPAVSLSRGFRALRTGSFSQGQASLAHGRCGGVSPRAALPHDDLDLLVGEPQEARQAGLGKAHGQAVAEAGLRGDLRQDLLPARQMGDDREQLVEGPVDVPAVPFVVLGKILAQAVASFAARDEVQLQPELLRKGGLLPGQRRPGEDDAVHDRQRAHHGDLQDRRRLRVAPLAARVLAVLLRARVVAAVEALGDAHRGRGRRKRLPRDGLEPRALTLVRDLLPQRGELAPVGDLLPRVVQVYLFEDELQLGNEGAEVRLEAVRPHRLRRRRRSRDRKVVQVNVQRFGPADARILEDLLVVHGLAFAFREAQLLPQRRPAGQRRLPDGLRPRLHHGRRGHEPLAPGSASTEGLAVRVVLILHADRPPPIDELASNPLHLCTAAPPRRRRGVHCVQLEGVRLEINRAKG
eukprot:scaffold923_cov256-Pinguiococcus_pyrenoidosus.AAC.21